MKISVRVTPRAKENTVITEADGSYRVRVTCVPEDGKATASVIKLLAKHFKKPQSAVVQIGGGTSRNKIFEII